MERACPVDRGVDARHSLLLGRAGCGLSHGLLLANSPSTVGAEQLARHSCRTVRPGTHRGRAQPISILPCCRRTARSGSCRSSTPDHRISPSRLVPETNYCPERFSNPDDARDTMVGSRSGRRRRLLADRPGVRHRPDRSPSFVGADREPVESVVTAVAVLSAVAGPLVLGLAAFRDVPPGGFRSRSPLNVFAPGWRRFRVAVKVNECRPVRERRDSPTRKDNERHVGPPRRRRTSTTTIRQRCLPRIRSPLSTITTALELAHRRPGTTRRCLIEDALLPEADGMRQFIEDLSDTCPFRRERTPNTHGCRSRCRFR